jgi:hypothetical protein
LHKATRHQGRLDELLHPRALHSAGSGRRTGDTARLRLARIDGAGLGVVTALLARCRATLEQLRDGAGRLGVPLGPIQSAVSALLGVVPA